MSPSEPEAKSCCSLLGGKTKGEMYEGIAFTFCKAALLILLTQKFALPVASGAASIFYVLAVVNGKKDTKCWARWPLAIAFFWAVVCAVSLAARLNLNEAKP